MLLPVLFNAMGINIAVKKITDKSTEKLWNNEEVPYYQTEDQGWFDHLRHSGDADFVMNNEFDFIEVDLPNEERELARPKDFNKCREWIKENVYEGNQSRLLNALDKMELDNTLAFRWSW